MNVERTTYSSANSTAGFKGAIKNLRRFRGKLHGQLKERKETKKTLMTAKDVRSVLLI